MHKLVPLNRIKSNPYRDTTRYPINPAKVEALLASIKKTGFWDNLVAREVKGRVELAYGEHRRQALLIFHKKNPGVKIPLIIKKLSEAQMIQIMANENMEEWGTNSTVEQETVRAVVVAYAKGKIELAKPQPMGKGGYKSIRMAPNFRAVKFRGTKFNPGDKPYNAESIARFLGWVHPGGQVSPRIRNALAVLETAEEMEAEEELEEITKDLGSAQAKETVVQMKKVRDAHKKEGATNATAKTHAVATGKAIAKDLRNGKEGRGIRGARAIAEEYKPQNPKEKEQPKIGLFMERFIGHVNKILYTDPAKTSMDAIMEYKAYIHPSQQKKMTMVLRRVIKRCEGFIQRFESPQIGTQLRKLKEK